MDTPENIGAPGGDDTPPDQAVMSLQQQAAALSQQYPDVFKKKSEDLPVTRKRPAGFGQAVADFLTTAKERVRESYVAQDRVAGKLAKSIERGVLDAVDNTSNAVVGTGAFIAHYTGIGHAVSGADFDEWYKHDTAEVNPLQIGEARKDALFGKRQGGVYDFVEHATSFTAALAMGNEASGVAQLGPGAARFLARVGLQGLATAASTDPRAARLSDMIEHGPPALTNPLTRWLKSGGKDSEALARFKSGLEGSMTGAAIDGLIAGMRPLVGLIRGKAAAGAAEALAPELPKTPPEPVRVAALPDGSYALEHNLPEPAKLPDGLVSAEPAPKAAEVPALIFDSAADAESHAAALNESIRVQSIPAGHIDDADIAALHEAVKNAPKDAKLEDVLPKGLFNYNYFGGPEASKAVIETLAQRFLEPVVGLKNRAADGLGTTGSELLTKARELVAKNDADSWLGQARGDADALPEIQARQLARKIVIKSMAGRVADLSRALDVNPANAVAASNMKAATEQLLHLAVETSGVDSGAGRLLQSLKNTVPQVKDALKAGAEAVAESEDAAPGSVPTPKAKPSPSGGPAGGEPDNLLAPPKGAGNAQAGDLPVREPRTSNPLLEALTPEDWRQMARQVRLSEGNPALILDAMLGKIGQRAAENDPSKWDLFNAYRANAMLSGPKTMLVNTASNAMAMFQAPAEYWMGGLLKGNTAVRQQGSDMLAGLWENSRSAWRVAAKAWRLGDSILDSRGVAADAGMTETLDMVNKGGTLGWLAKFQLPGRILMATDEFFKNVNYLNSVRSLSMRAAREDMANMEPMTAKEAGEFMASRLADDLRAATDVNGHALNPVALSFARDATFQTPLTGMGKTLQESVQAHPSLRVVLPFVRTPINLLRYSWHRTPVLGALARDMAADIAAGGDRAAVALGKQSMGAMVWGTAAMYALQGNMTGAGPTDPKLRKQWLDAGHQPYSVRVPGTDTWLSYRRLDQLGTPLGLVADMVEMSGETPDEDTQNALGKFVAAISANLMSKTFLATLADFFDAVHSGDPGKMNRMFEGLVGSVIPAALRQVDPNDGYAEVRGYLDSIKSRVPGLSDQLEPRRNILGEPVMKPPGYLNYTLNPFTLSPGGRIDPVQDALVQMGKSMTMPSPKEQHIDLTDRGQWKPTTGKNQSPYDRMLELMGEPPSGPSLRQTLTELISSPGWATWSDEMRQLQVQAQLQAAQVVAKQRMLAEYPSLAKALTAVPVNKGTALGAGRPQTADSRPQFMTP